MKQNKLITTILSGGSDANIAFDDLCGLLRRLGFVERTKGSHHIFRKDYVMEKINYRRRAMHKYETIIYWSDVDQAFLAEVPELPGCTAHGDSQENALANVTQAIELWITTAKEFGDPVPQAKGARLMYA